LELSVHLSGARLLWEISGLAIAVSAPTILPLTLILKLIFWKLPK
jgi:hypothetical protein